MRNSMDLFRFFIPRTKLHLSPRRNGLVKACGRGAFGLN